MKELGTGTERTEVLPPLQGGDLRTGGANGLSIAALQEMAAAVDQRVAILDRIKQIIDARVAVDCFDKFEDTKQDGTKEITVRRNKNYADIVAATIGAGFEFLKDPEGRPLVTRINYQDDKGPYYVYECYGRAYIGQHSIECSGAASSRDKFLSRGGRLDVTQVDERYVRQMAATECRKKGILSLLGLSGDSSAGEMEKIGKKAGTFAGATFQKGKSGGSVDTSDQADKRAQIERMARALVESGFAIPGEAPLTTPESVLKAITLSRTDKKPDGKFAGWGSFKAISEKSIDRTFSDVKRVFDKYVQGDPESSPDAAKADPAKTDGAAAAQAGEKPDPEGSFKW
jgi:hypothetical protein